MRSIIYFLKKFYPVILGALGGYIYYFYIGCASGTCPITSNPYISTGYGALVGGVLTLNNFSKKRKDN